MNECNEFDVGTSFLCEGVSFGSVISLTTPLDLPM